MLIKDRDGRKNIFDKRLIALHPFFFCSILLYSKVGEAAEMQEAASVWLNCPSNCGSAGFRTVAELYLLHILVPLGHFEEAREFIAGEVGGIAFAERKQAALNIVEEKAQQSREAALRSGIHPASEISAHPNSVKGLTFQSYQCALCSISCAEIMTRSS